MQANNSQRDVRTNDVRNTSVNNVNVNRNTNVNVNVDQGAAAMAAGTTTITRSQLRQQ